MLAAQTKLVQNVLLEQCAPKPKRCSRDGSPTMNDDFESKRKEVTHIVSELNGRQLSRRGLLDRLKGLGVGFGAAFMLGMKETHAHNAPDATAKLKSTNAALNNIIEEGSPTGPVGELEGATQAEGRPVQTAAYFRGYRRVFRRVYGRI